ncbi:MAG: zinc-binding dehydrogenase [Acidimicrobiia bacterium]|nr:zinc-binding dehydrogenase [Acidimicrobiia bacterium]
MKPETHRRIVVSQKGGPEVLELVEKPTLDPKPGEVRIKVQAAGVSAFDAMISKGKFPGFPRVPLTPGCDVVGVVDKLGEGVSTLELGEAVAAGPFTTGGYTESICLPAAEVVPVPPAVDPAEAVCLIANYLTAHLMLHTAAEVRSGERILIQGAAGGVGTALLELGGLAGLEMWGTASQHNHELVSELGATPIDYRNEDVVERVRSLTDGGVDAVFDPIGGGRQLWRSYRTLRKGGRLVWFGVAATSKHGMKVIPASLLARLALSLIPDGKKAPMTPNADKIDQQPTLVELLDLLASGKIKPVVADRIPLAEARRAHETLAKGRYAGRMVLIASD